MAVCLVRDYILLILLPTLIVVAWLGEFVCVWPFEVKAPFSGITSLSSQGKGVEPVIFRQVKKWSETLPNRFNLFSVNINWQGSNLNGFAFN